MSSKLSPLTFKLSKNRGELVWTAEFSHNEAEASDHQDVALAVRTPAHSLTPMFTKWCNETDAAALDRMNENLAHSPLYALPAELLNMIMCHLEETDLICFGPPSRRLLSIVAASLTPRIQIDVCKRWLLGNKLLADQFYVGKHPSHYLLEQLWCFNCGAAHAATRFEKLEPFKRPSQRACPQSRGALWICSHTKLSFNELRLLAWLDRPLWCRICRFPREIRISFDAHGSAFISNDLLIPPRYGFDHPRVFYYTVIMLELQQAHKVICPHLSTANLSVISNLLPSHLYEGWGSKVFIPRRYYSGRRRPWEHYGTCKHCGVYYELNSRAPHELCVTVKTPLGKLTDENETQWWAQLDLGLRPGFDVRVLLEAGEADYMAERLFSPVRHA